MLTGLYRGIAHLMTGGANHLEIDTWRDLPLSKKINYLETTDPIYWESLIEYAPVSERETLIAAAKLQSQKLSEVKS